MSRPTSSENLIAQLTAWMRKQFGWSPEKKHLWKDDWTLTVKLHAMIETCLNGALVKELDRTGLASVIAKLDTSVYLAERVAMFALLFWIGPRFHLRHDFLVNKNKRKNENNSISISSISNGCDHLGGVNN